MTLKEYFLSSDPDVYTTKIILKNLRKVIIHSENHGDLTMDDIVLKDGILYMTNRFLQSHSNMSEFQYLGPIQRELLEEYGVPESNRYPNFEETDNAIYDYLYYLLINTSGEQRKELIQAGLESCYKTLFDEVPNKYIEDQKYSTVKQIISLIDTKEESKRYKRIHGFNISMF